MARKNIYCAHRTINRLEKDQFFTCVTCGWTESTWQAVKDVTGIVIGYLDD